jgi:hypothetical protein
LENIPTTRGHHCETDSATAKNPTLQKMLAKYAGIDTEAIDRNDEIQQAIQSAMYRSLS